MKEIVIRALLREVEGGEVAEVVDFPIVRSGCTGSIRVTPAGIEAVEVDDDAGR